mgnify:CR=1 FL=1
MHVRRKVRTVIRYLYFIPEDVNENENYKKHHVSQMNQYSQTDLLLTMLLLLPKE